jgi:hydroxymethylpyrimidine/phosphomethylpyrimidine kinase
MEVSPDFLKQQIDAVFEDIRPDAVKVGMVSSAVLVEVIAERLSYYHAENIVVDPVMLATSGSVLSKDSAINAMKESLLPMATVITPNIPEAEILYGRKITTLEHMEIAAKKIADIFGCAVLCKGGHSINDANDLLYAADKYTWFNGKKIDNPNTHGTGCTLSSAIASNLAKGYPLEKSIERAKAYISGALGSMLNLGRGAGPLDHIFDVDGVFRR